MGRSVGLIVGLAFLALAGCGGPGVVAGDDVAAEASKQLGAEVGREPDSLTCPDLKAEVGEKIRCELTDGGTTLGATVTVTSVDGDDARFDIVVDDEPSK